VSIGAVLTGGGGGCTAAGDITVGIVLGVIGSAGGGGGGGGSGKETPVSSSVEPVTGGVTGEPGKLTFVPAKIKFPPLYLAFDSNLGFNCFNSFKLIPASLAIFESVSPRLTVYFSVDDFGG
jgi:hypothetical protein